jgi:hypothetical protein
MSYKDSFKLLNNESLTTIFLISNGNKIKKCGTNTNVDIPDKCLEDCFNDPNCNAVGSNMIAPLPGSDCNAPNFCTANIPFDARNINLGNQTTELRNASNSFYSNMLKNNSSDKLSIAAYKTTKTNSKLQPVLSYFNKFEGVPSINNMYTNPADFESTQGIEGCVANCVIDNNCHGFIHNNTKYPHKTDCWKITDPIQGSYPYVSFSHKYEKLKDPTTFGTYIMPNISKQQTSDKYYENLKNDYNVFENTKISIANEKPMIGVLPGQCAEICNNNSDCVGFKSFSKKIKSQAFPLGNDVIHCSLISNIDKKNPIEPYKSKDVTGLVFSKKSENLLQYRDIYNSKFEKSDQCDNCYYNHSPTDSTTPIYDHLFPGDIFQLTDTTGKVPESTDSVEPTESFLNYYGRKIVKY